MKEDAPIPARIPRKKREIERVLDRWIAVWLADEETSPGDRKRLREEKDRRKTLAPPLVLGVVTGPEGVTPQQLEAAEHIFSMHPYTEVYHVRTTNKLRRLFPEVPVRMAADLNTVVRASGAVVAFPRKVIDPQKDRGNRVWEAVKYAKNRNIPVEVLLPDGTKMSERN